MKRIIFLNYFLYFFVIGSKIKFDNSNENVNSFEEFLNMLQNDDDDTPSTFKKNTDIKKNIPNVEVTKHSIPQQGHQANNKSII
jgi:hypothetical protein